MCALYIKPNKWDKLKILGHLQVTSQILLPLSATKYKKKKKNYSSGRLSAALKMFSIQCWWTCIGKMCSICDCPTTSYHINLCFVAQSELLRVFLKIIFWNLGCQHLINISSALFLCVSPETVSSLCFVCLKTIRHQCIFTSQSNKNRWNVCQDYSTQACLWPS